MLLRSARLPVSGDYSYEPKWDGFRCLASRNGRLRAVSRRGISIVLVVFDVLAIDGCDVTRRPYWERRQLLEQLDLNGEHWATTSAYADGEALWDKVVEIGLEGVVAKRRSGHYLPGRRGWIKTKNPRVLALPARGRGCAPARGVRSADGLEHEPLTGGQAGVR
jgi:ATP-dependent DNA ligase